ncbi:MAG: rubrerythrin family protein [Thermodesulfobacteriota bacterium]
MGDDFAYLLEESLQLELNIADLYLLFEKLFPEDAKFWWQLSLEEKNHGALIRSGKEMFLPIGQFPHDFIKDRLQILIDTNSEINSLIRKYQDNGPSREEAFNIAFDIENSVGELHYQVFMDREAGSKIDDIFQQLNKNDKDHADRIKFYMQANNISLQSENL